MKTKISEVDVLLEQIRSQVCANKQSESYSCLLSDSLEVRGKGRANRRDNKAAKNGKRKERRKIKDQKRFCNAIDSRKQYIKNLSNEQLTDEQNYSTIAWSKVYRYTRVVAKTKTPEN